LMQTMQTTQKSSKIRAYLDNSATTMPCKEAVDAACFAMEEAFFNPSAAYGPAITVIKAMNSCRSAVTYVLGQRTGEVIFTSGGTEGNFIAIAGAMKRRGARLAMTTAAEHPAVLECVKSFEHIIIPVDSSGLVDLESFKEKVKKSEGLGVVSAMEVNNETGAVLPVAKMAKIVKENSGALFHCDGVQGFLHLKERDLNDVDSYAISAHKIHGLKGSGALWIREGVSLGKVIFGGGQEKGMRSGTENTPGIFALEAAINADQGSAISNMRELKLRLYEGIMEIFPSALVNGPEPEDSEKSAPHILNISFPGILSEVLLHALEGDGVFVSTGSACAARQSRPSHVLSAMGMDPQRIKSAVRFSLSRYTSAEEIDIALESLKKHLPILSKFRRR
jgi:cysteine desulfurase